MRKSNTPSLNLTYDVNNGKALLYSVPVPNTPQNSMIADAFYLVIYAGIIYIIYVFVDRVHQYMSKQKEQEHEFTMAEKDRAHRKEIQARQFELIADLLKSEKVTDSKDCVKVIQAVLGANQNLVVVDSDDSDSASTKSTRKSLKH